MLRIRKSRVHLLIFALIVLLRNDFFDYFGINDVVIAGLRLRDLAFVVSVLWTLWVLAYEKGWAIRAPFNGMIWAFILILLVSCVVSYVIFSQPVLLGFQAQRDVISGFFTFFALDTLICRGKLKKEDFLRVFVCLCVAQLLFNCIHWLLYQFLGVNFFSGAIVFSSRYGSARIIFSQSESIVFLMGYCLNAALNRKEHMLRYLALFFTGCFHFMVAGKLRAATVAILAAAVVTILLWRKTSLVKIGIMLLALLALVVAEERIPIVKDLLDTFFNDSSETINTMLIRSTARRYYLQRFSESPVFGWGFPHMDWSAAYSEQGKELGYYFSDNGMFSFLYIYGGVGLLWLLLFGWKYVQGTAALLKKDQYSSLFFGVYQVVMLITGMYWAIGSQQMPMIMALIMMSDEMGQSGAGNAKGTVTAFRPGGRRKERRYS